MVSQRNFLVIAFPVCVTVSSPKASCYGFPTCELPGWEQQNPFVRSTAWLKGVVHCNMMPKKDFIRPHKARSGECLLGTG